MISFLLKNYSGVGKKTAEKMIAFHESNGSLEVLRHQMTYDPHAVDFSVVTNRQIGLAEQSTQKIADLIYRDLLLKLGGSGVRDAVLKSIGLRLASKVANSADCEHPIKAAWQLFVSNPYEPIEEVWGYSFTGADALARQVGIPKYADIRLASLVTHLVQESSTSYGHSYLTYDELAKSVAAFDPDIALDVALKSANELSQPIGTACVNGQKRYYPIWALKTEQAHARLLSDSLSKSIDAIRPLYYGDRAYLDAQIDHAQKARGGDFALDESQRDALRGLLLAEQTIHTITAGPGCGKTALMEIFVQMVISNSLGAGKHALEAVSKSLNVFFCAPTGKAAKVLNGRISKSGVIAKTIHSLLEVTEEGFVHHSGNRLAADVIIIDESSMLDLSLAHSLISSAPDHCHLIFLGDINQLPAVACGNVLSDLLSLPFDHHRLQKTHRNAGPLLKTIGEVGSGEIDCVDNAAVRYLDLPNADDMGISKIVSYYLQQVQSCGGDYSKVGLLTSRRKGNIDTPGWNTTYLNHVLRGQCNPLAKRIVGTSFHINDRIIIRKNQLIPQGKKSGADGSEVLLVEQVVNGDTGRIEATVMGSNDDLHAIRIALDDGRSIVYPIQSIDAIELAYAITIHSSQGSEYERVIFIGTNGSPTFIHRGTVFTGMSRAKKYLTVFAQPQTLKSICKRESPKRNSGLIDWVLNK
jgi:exodeoxyribonuclease V alpha subunit